MSAYELLGKEDGIRALVERFYHYMDTLPECAPIRAMHPKDLSGSIEKLWMFLVGRFGGPNIYIERRGHPRLRRRHMPFPIGPSEADQWMVCMDRALVDEVEDPAIRQELSEFFNHVAQHMRNR